MTLHEIYETLLRRGMPPHEHLRPVGGLLCHKAFDDEYGRQSTTALPDEDTRDLITMHALRWYMEEGWNYQPGECSRIAFTEIEPIELYYQDNSGGGVANTPSTNADILRGPKWWAWQWYKPHKRRIHAIGSGPTILDAILAATAHLEPK